MSDKVKKISNRYDYFEILSCFTQSTDEVMLSKNQPVRKMFIIKCILGPLLALNAWNSHWGPIKWPANYYILIFSIVFYYIISHIYNRLDVVDKHDGAFIGQYESTDKNKRKYLMNISDNKLEYTLDQIDSSSNRLLRRKTFLYTDYFTQEGEFLDSLYKTHLGGFLKNAKILKQGQKV